MEILLNQLLFISLSQPRVIQYQDLVKLANMIDLTKNVLLTWQAELAISQLNRDIENRLNLMSYFKCLIPLGINNHGKEDVDKFHNQGECLTITEDSSRSLRKVNSFSSGDHNLNGQVREMIKSCPEFPRKNIGNY